jgi:DNA-binding NtrC family response regulator
MTLTPKIAIICVDDDKTILQALHFQLDKMINNSKVLCEFFESPEEALETMSTISEENIEIIFILSDYQMPKMTGEEFLRIAKAHFPDVACVMLSGQANETSVQQLLNEGLLDVFIAKPWSEEKLFESVRNVLKDSDLNPTYLSSKQK